MHECEPPPLIDEYTRSAFTGGRAWPKMLSPQHSRDCARNPCFGANNYGQAGGIHTPGPGGGNSFIIVSAGLFHTCAIKRGAFHRVLGNNQFGQAPAARIATY